MALAECLFTLTAVMVDLYPPNADVFLALAAHCDTDHSLVAPWLWAVLDLVDRLERSRGHGPGGAVRVPDGIQRRGLEGI